MYVDGELVGGVWLEEHDQYFQLREVQLQPGFRNRGIGTEVISRCISMGREARKPIRLRVLRTSPAVKLYARLGFELYGEKKSSKQFLMELRP